MSALALLQMLIEYCDGGALDSIMVELEKPLTEPQIAYVCKEMCKALTFLHANKVIHRDLKAGNVLLTMDAGVKIGEYFFARSKIKGEIIRLKTNAPVLRYFRE